MDIANAAVVAGHEVCFRFGNPPLLTASKVSVYTAHHDESRCFCDTLSEGGDYSTFKST